MTRRNKNKPSSPEEIARRASERRAARAEVERLTAQGVDAKVETVKERDANGVQRERVICRATRLDVFDLLLSRNALDRNVYEAFRGHERDLHIALGVETPERRPDYVRASAEGAPGQNVTQRMIDASEVVALTERRIGSRDRALLKALMHPGAAVFRRWRIIIQQHTGETRDECQASAIRYLGANLLSARSVAIKAAAEMRERRATGRAANDEIEGRMAG